MNNEKRHSSCRFTILEELQIIEDYENKVGGSTILGRKYGCHPTTIENILKAYGIKLRTLSEARNIHRTLIEDIFEDIDTPEKAYWLGVMYTDGYISKTNPYTHYFGISVKSSDIEWLENFKKFLNYNGEVKTYKQTVGYSAGSDYSRLLIGSNKIVASLEKWGVVENKTNKIISMPDINFKEDFIRGVIDGDGSIRKDNHQLRIHGQELFLRSIGDYLGVPYTITPDKSIYCLSYGLPESRKLLNLLYKNSSTYLKRKYELAKEVFMEDLVTSLS